MRYLPWAVLTCIALTPCSRFAFGQPGERFTFSEAIMGTEFRILVYAADAELVEQAAEAAWLRGHEIDSMMSDWQSGSELSRLALVSGADSCAAVSPELLAVLMYAQRVSEESRGAFDVTVGPLSRLWRWSMRRGELPTDSRMKAARASVGYRNLVVDPGQQCVRLTLPDMQLDLGGIAKGYAADEMLKSLTARGFGSALIDAGGDIVAGDAPSDAPSWVIDTRSLGADGHLSWEGLPLANAAVATSGDRYRYLVAGGIRYSHLLDPRTGFGITEQRHVTVVAPTGIAADALASAISVMGADGAFLADRPGYGARVIESDGDESRLTEVGVLKK